MLFFRDPSGLWPCMPGPVVEWKVLSRFGKTWLDPPWNGRKTRPIFSHFFRRFWTYALLKQATTISIRMKNGGKLTTFSWLMLMGGGSFLSINKLTKRQYHHQASAAEVKTSGDPKGQLNCCILGKVTGGKVVASWLFSWLVGSLIVLYILIVDLELTMRNGGAIWPILATLIAALSPLYPLMLVRRLVWVLLFQNDPCKTWLRWSLIPWIFLDLCSCLFSTTSPFSFFFYCRWFVSFEIPLCSGIHSLCWFVCQSEGGNLIMHRLHTEQFCLWQSKLQSKMLRQGMMRPGDFN